MKEGEKGVVKKVSIGDTYSKLDNENSNKTDMNENKLKTGRWIPSLLAPHLPRSPCPGNLLVKAEVIGNLVLLRSHVSRAPASGDADRNYCLISLFGRRK